MPTKARIDEKRAAAKRVRSIAQRISNRDDQQRVLRFAADLDAEADALERTIVSTAPPVTNQPQQQLQQQGQTDPGKSKPKA